MMLNHIFIFVLLLPLVFSETASEDRQWQEGDNRQNCTTVCSDECTECDEPSLCDPETEIKCGETPQNNDIYELVVNCPPNDVCIDIGCECKLPLFLAGLSRTGQWEQKYILDISLII